MTTLAKIIVASIMSILMMSCNFDGNFGIGTDGNGNVTTETRNINETFEGIHASEGLDVYITQSNNQEVKVEADENLQEIIETYVEDGILKVGVDGAIRKSTSQKVMISCGNLTSIKSTSGSDVFAEGVIKSADLSLTATSGSDMQLEVEADNLVCKTTSGADMKISGRANSLTAEATSGSDLEAGDLIASKCNAKATSGADLSVNTKDELIAKATSGGDIRYQGNPKSVKKNDEVSGSVRKN